MHKLCKKHVKDAFCIIKYLYNTCNEGITFREDSWNAPCGTGCHLYMTVVYVDSSLAGSGPDVCYS